MYSAALFGYWQRIIDFGLHQRVLRAARRTCAQTKPLVNNNIVEIETTPNQVQCSHKLQRGSKSQTALGGGASVGSRRAQRAEKNFYLLRRLKVPSVVQQAQHKHRVERTSRLYSRGSLLLSTHILFICSHYTTAAVQFSTDEGKLNQKKKGRIVSIFH